MNAKTYMQTGRRRQASGALRQRREMVLSGTVEVWPCLSHSTLAVPALASTERTRPISPVAVFRT
jgi:hypothetical protein